VLSRIFALLAFLDGLVLADLIGDGPSSCAGSASDQGSLSTACKTADYGPACCGASHYLGSGVMGMIFPGLLTFRAVVRGLLLGGCLLGQRHQWKRKNAAKRHKGCCSVSRAMEHNCTSFSRCLSGLDACSERLMMRQIPSRSEKRFALRWIGLPDE
jgi:hypothetical protein